MTQTKIANPLPTLHRRPTTTQKGLSAQQLLKMAQGATKTLGTIRTISTIARKGIETVDNFRGEKTLPHVHNFCKEVENHTNNLLRLAFSPENQSLALTVAHGARASAHIAESTAKLIGSEHPHIQASTTKIKQEINKIHECITKLHHLTHSFEFNLSGLRNFSQAMHSASLGLAQLSLGVETLSQNMKQQNNTNKHMKLPLTQIESLAQAVNNASSEAKEFFHSIEMMCLALERRPLHPTYPQYKQGIAASTNLFFLGLNKFASSADKMLMHINTNTALLCDATQHTQEWIAPVKEQSKQIASLTGHAKKVEEMRMHYQAIIENLQHITQTRPHQEQSVAHSVDNQEVHLTLLNQTVAMAHKISELFVASQSLVQAAPNTPPTSPTSA